MTELLVRAADRFVTHGDGIVTRHVFSFGAHYDPDRVGFGPVSAVNCESVGPAAGYDLHRHSGVDIVTYVVAGDLEHEDSLAGTQLLGPGSLQSVRAGGGVNHAERNASATEPLEFVQLMFRAESDAPAIAPERAQTVSFGRDGWVRVVGPDALPPAPNGYAVLCISGSTHVAGCELFAGDSLFSMSALGAVRASTAGIAIAVGFAARETALTRGAS